MRKNLVYIISDIDKALAFEWISLYLDKSKYTLSFILLNNKNSVLEDFLIKHAIPVYRVTYNGKKSLPKAFLKVCFRLVKLRADIVHTHLIDACLIGLMAAKIVGVPKRIHTRHYSTFHHLYFPKSVFYDKVVNYLSTDIIAITEVVKKVLIEKEAVDPHKIRLIHHGFQFEDRDEIEAGRTATIYSKYNFSLENTPVIGVISRFVDWKGIQYIIPAFEKVVKSYPNALLLLANATGPYTEELYKLLHKLPQKSYRVIRFEPDIFALYKTFDMYVHVPINEDIEAFGQTYVESLAIGLPCIFTNSGVAHEFIKDRENALLVPYENTQAIEEAMRLLLSDHALARSIAEKGKKDVWDKFKLNNMIAGLEQVYDA